MNFQLTIIKCSECGNDIVVSDYSLFNKSKKICNNCLTDSKKNDTKQKGE
jgi:hypothetical protein